MLENVTASASTRAASLRGFGAAHAEAMAALTHLAVEVWLPIEGSKPVRAERDLSALPTNTGANPQITVMAHALRVAASVAGEAA